MTDLSTLKDNYGFPLHLGNGKPNTRVELALLCIYYVARG
jgi:hypothetical protein